MENLSKQEYDRQYYLKNKPQCLQRGLASVVKRHFGLSLSAYEEIRHTFPQICAICKNPEQESRRLSLDHNHKTKKIRGLLCSNCNKALGLLKDSIELLERAKEYLNAEYE